MDTNRTWISRLGATLALLVAASCTSGRRLDQAPLVGLVVEKVEANGLASAVGIQPGDLLLDWRRGIVGGELVSPFDIDQLRVEEAPRGVVRLTGGRGMTPQVFDLGEREWGMSVRPTLGVTAEQALAAARATAGVEGAEQLRVLAQAEYRPAVRAWLLAVAAELAGVDAGAELWAEALESAGAAPWSARLTDRLADALRSARRLDAAEQVYSEALGRQAPESLTAATILENLAFVARARGDWHEAQSRFRRAFEIRQRLAPDSLAVAASLNSLGSAAAHRGDLDGAESLHRRALEIRQRLAPGSLLVATSLNNIGNVASDRSELDAADVSYLKALEIQQRLAPGSRDEAGTLNNLGITANRRGDLVTAEVMFQRALAIQERLTPGGFEVAICLNNLGTLVDARGDLRLAESLYRRALEIWQRLAPDSLQVAAARTNLSAVLAERGDLEAAELDVREALEIRERLAPDSLDVASALNNLGQIACDRGDLETAVGFHRRAIEIRERRAPDSLSLASSLVNLGVVAAQQGDYAAAESSYRRALEIYQRLAPDSLAVAICLSDLGGVVLDRGADEAAEDHFRRALEIQERLAPGGISAAMSLSNLGRVALKRDDLQVAEERFRKSLATWERLAPGSTHHADCLHQLGCVLRARGRRSEALDAMRQAVQALETQQRRFGGSPEQLGEFRTRFRDLYGDLVDLLVEEGQAGEAFAVLEAGRARAMLAMLAERDIVAIDVPPELERERRLANAEYQRAMDALGKVPEDKTEERTRLATRLDEINLRQQEIGSSIRAASPRLAELRYPEPLGLAAAQELLEPGCLLLAWSLGAERSVLLAVSRDGISAHLLAIGEQAVRQSLRRLRLAVQTPTAPPDSARSLGRELAHELLGPVTVEIAAAERLVLVPDGPLWLLPFAALAEPSEPAALLIENRPLSVVASTTVLSQLARDRGRNQAASAVAFGDPVYPRPRADRTSRNGPELMPLPSTRVEVEDIRKLYGDRATLWLGAEATEERAKALTGDIGVVHFASHGLVDEHRPLSSALALTIPPQPGELLDDGFLQAWEVFERMRFSAELVTLSACETALGREVAGEGLVGLTRAFQYAGARSVLASLWSVADESTAELMRLFYEGLRSGLPKDEALRQAQLAFLEGRAPSGVGQERKERDLSHPFYWAPFQLVGDWK